MFKRYRRFTFGPGGALYCLVTFVVLIVALLTQSNILYWGFGLTVGGLVVSALQCALMMRGLEIQRIPPSHGVVGESMVIRYQVRNRKRWTPAFGLVIHEQWKPRRGKSKRKSETPSALRGTPFGWVLHLGPGQQIQAEAPCVPTHRGVLEFERVVMSTSFPFGILRRKITVDLPGSVLVYPRLWRIKRRVLHRLSRIDPAGRKRMERPGGHEEFLGLREYRPGDSIRMIDWKRTARSGTLVSREMTQPSPPRIMIALDLSRSDDDDIDEQIIEDAVSLTASLVCDAHFHGCQVGLAVSVEPPVAFPIHHSLPHRQRLLESLARLDTRSWSGQWPPMPAEPNVRVGLCPPLSGPQRTMVLDAHAIEAHVRAIEGGAATILNGRAATRLQRRELDTTWT